MGFPDGSVGKESTCNAGDPSSIPGSGRSTREETGYPLQYSWASLVAQLVTNPPAMLETWVGKIPWRRKWQPTPVHLLEKFYGWRSLVGYSPWGRKESDTNERLHFHFTLFVGHLWVFVFLWCILITTHFPASIPNPPASHPFSFPHKLIYV